MPGSDNTLRNVPLATCSARICQAAAAAAVSASLMLPKEEETDGRSLTEGESEGQLKDQLARSSARLLTTPSADSWQITYDERAQRGREGEALLPLSGPPASSREMFYLFKHISRQR